MWQTKGLIFNKHHAQLPTIVKNINSFRIYYSTKVKNLSHIRFFDIDNKLNIISHDKEALSPGEYGSFDDSGVMPSCVIDNTMYYTGWHLKKNVPYGHAIGTAKICDDGTLKRTGIALNKHNKIVNSPYVEKKDNQLQMLYCNGTGWIDNYPTYNIALATNKDGFWKTKEDVIITHNEKDEAISRVSKSPDGFIYYAWRQKNTNYQLFKIDALGYKKKVCVPRSDWDSEMQCYPFVCEIDNLMYMFYNGNGYGATGIGVAQWKVDIN